MARLPLHSSGAIIRRNVVARKRFLTRWVKLFGSRVGCQEKSSVFVLVRPKRTEGAAQRTFAGTITEPFLSLALLFLMNYCPRQLNDRDAGVTKCGLEPVRIYVQVTLVG